MVLHERLTTLECTKISSQVPIPFDPVGRMRTLNRASCWLPPRCPGGPARRIPTRAVGRGYRNAARLYYQEKPLVPMIPATMLAPTRFKIRSNE